MTSPNPLESALTNVYQNKGLITPTESALTNLVADKSFTIRI